MALTKRQQITLYQLLGVPFSEKVGRIIDVDNMLVQMYQPAALDHLAHLKIQERLAELAGDADTLADLVTCLDRWYCLFGDSTRMESGGIGTTTGVSFDLTEERRQLRERVLAIVPFSREYMREEMGRVTRGRLMATVIR